VAVRSSELPADFVPVATGREPVVTTEGDHGIWSDRAREQTERLRKRARQLTLVNAVGGRLSGLSEQVEIVDAAVDELHRAFEYFLCSVLRLRDDGYVESVAARGLALERIEAGRWSQPLESGLIGRCVRERRPVMSGDVRAEPDYRLVPFMIDVRSELCVPIWVGERVWGAIDIEEVQPDGFDEDDARVVQTVADQVGSALRAASLVRELEARSSRAGPQEAVSASSEARQSRSTLAS
jgi:GAF domain-containing protein